MAQQTKTPGAEPSRSSDAVAVGVAVRDPSVEEVLLALLRLNRMQVQELGRPLHQIEVGPPVGRIAVLVGYVSSAEDAEYFDGMLRKMGDPPSMALIHRDTDPAVVKRVKKRATRVVRLPEQAQVIADAIRDQLAGAPVASRRPSKSPVLGSSEPR